MKTYNGYRSWNCWNVNLWLTNDESTYGFALGVLKDMGLQNATDYLALALRGQKTPDGAIYNRRAIFESLKTWEIDNDEV